MSLTGLRHLRDAFINLAEYFNKCLLFLHERPAFRCAIWKRTASTWMQTAWVLNDLASHEQCRRNERRTFVPVTRWMMRVPRLRLCTMEYRSTPWRGCLANFREIRYSQ